MHSKMVSIAYVAKEKIVYVHYKRLSLHKDKRLLVLVLALIKTKPFFFEGSDHNFSEDATTKRSSNTLFGWR